jgi:hypothetical protein
MPAHLHQDHREALIYHLVRRRPHPAPIGVGITPLRPLDPETETGIGRGIGTANEIENAIVTPGDEGVALAVPFLEDLRRTEVGEVDERAADLVEVDLGVPNFSFLFLGFLILLTVNSLIGSFVPRYLCRLRDCTVCGLGLVQNSRMQEFIH